MTCISTQVQRIIQVQDEASSRGHSLPLTLPWTKFLDKRMSRSRKRKTWNLRRVGYGGVKRRTSRHLVLFFVSRWSCSHHRRCPLLNYLSACPELLWCSYFAPRYKLGCDHRSDVLDRGGRSRRVSEGGWIDLGTKGVTSDLVSTGLSQRNQSRSNKCERVGIYSLELEPVVV